MSGCDNLCRGHYITMSALTRCPKHPVFIVSQFLRVHSLDTVDVGPLLQDLTRLPHGVDRGCGLI